jgi:hypothetical protein
MPCLCNAPPCAMAIASGAGAAEAQAEDMVVGRMNGELERMSLLIMETQMVTRKQSKERAVNRLTAGTVETMSMGTGEPAQKPRTVQAGMVRTPKPQVLRRYQTLLPHPGRTPPRQCPLLPAPVIHWLSPMLYPPPRRAPQIRQSALEEGVRAACLRGAIRSRGIADVSPISAPWPQQPAVNAAPLSAQHLARQQR